MTDGASVLPLAEKLARWIPNLNPKCVMCHATLESHIYVKSRKGSSCGSPHGQIIVDYWQDENHT